MSYPRFFVDLDSIEGNKIVLDGESAKHISRSLRMTAGERIVVCDKQKNEYECVLETFSQDTVTAVIEDVRRSVSEPLYNAVVYQACPKSDKMDSIVQKAVELGAYGIVAFMSDRCVARYDSHGFEKKCERWQKIAKEAAKQSGRGYVPFVRWLPDLKSAVDEMTQKGKAFMCYEDEDALNLKEYIRSTTDEQDISFMIGSEGGFSPKEAEYCRENGIATVGLGKRILRTETASGYVLSCLAYEKEL
ncbi:MAG: 16S rRNA (uracil(1498)-N(3))-methyltransferase [Ruminococcaceae bacterium]|nr:16S rRNA (uracil(1498)-N(3))-methyltransferase [Oscillospiraceae bacterium]